MNTFPLWTRSVSSTLQEWLRPDGLTLICGHRQASCRLLGELGEAMSVEPVSLTELALAGEPARTAQELLDRLTGKTLLFDLETICWSPWLRLDPVRFLRQHSHRQGIVAVWPGTVTGRTVTYSATDRRDYVSADARGLGVLRPIPTRFPDEVPFTIERIPA